LVKAIGRIDQGIVGGGRKGTDQQDLEKENQDGKDGKGMEFQPGTGQAKQCEADGSTIDYFVDTEVRNQ